jgi:hypothetical protein
MDPKVLFERLITWAREHPEELLAAARNAAGLRITVPLEGLRVAVEQMQGPKAPKDVEIRAVPPGLRLGATLFVMKTHLRVEGTLFIEALRLSPAELRLEIRLKDLALSVLGEAETPVAMLIKSGVLDVSQPGKLVSNLPKRPPFIVEGQGDRIVLDLLRDPRIARKVNRITRRLLPLVTLTGAETSGDHLALQVQCFPGGVGAALSAARVAP